MLPLTTRRLTLRAFRASDLSAFVAYRSDPAVAQYQGWEAPYSPAEAAALVAEMMHRWPGQPGAWYQIAVELTATGQLVGDCAVRVLAEETRQAEIGVTLARPYQGHGYATEALTSVIDYLFSQLGLHRIYAACDVENAASAALLERLGMRREGHFIESVWFKGQWASEYWYAILQQEWLTRQRGSTP